MRLRRVLVAFVFAMLAQWPMGGHAAEFADIYKSVRPSVVYIVSAVAKGAQSGSGFVYDSNGSTTIIATAYHVVEGAQKIDVIFDGDQTKRHPALIREYDRKRDIAFLEVSVGNRKPLKLAQRSQISEGASVALIGYPRAAITFTRTQGDELRPSVHMGVISALHLAGEIVQFDAQGDHGDSGGPVIDAKTGAVVGIVRGAIADPTVLGQLGVPLPGSGIALSAPLIYAVRNGIAPQSSPAQATVAAGPAVLGSSSGAYRLGFVGRNLGNPASQTFSDTELGRIREHFTADNAVYAIPIDISVLNAESSKIMQTCQDQRINAILHPFVFWNYDNSTARVIISLGVDDCAGVPLFVSSKMKVEKRMSAVSIGKELADVANDLIDQVLVEFDQYRTQNEKQWKSLVQTGEPFDGDAANHVQVGAVKKDGQLRIHHVRPGGLGDRMGLREDDVISQIDGQAPDMTSISPAQFAIALDKATSVVVKRPEGAVTIVLRTPAGS